MKKHEKKDFEALTALYDKLSDECIRVNKILKRLYEETNDDMYKACYYAYSPIEIDSDGVSCDGIEYGPFGGSLTHHYYIQNEFLFMTDEELNEYVDCELKKYNEEKERQQRMVKMHERMHKESEYKRLEKELGYELI